MPHLLRVGKVTLLESAAVGVKLDLHHLPPVPVGPPRPHLYLVPLTAAKKERPRRAVGTVAEITAGGVLGTGDLERGTEPGITGRHAGYRARCPATINIVTPNALAVPVMADLRHIPLAEMPALGLDVLGRTIGRVLPDASVITVPVAAFQSSV